MIKRWLEAWHQDVTDWCHQRNPWIRLPILLWMAWLAWTWTLDRSAWTLMSGINLGIHEGGHLLFRFFGDVLHALGGTILQLAVPVIAGGMLARQRDWFGVAFALTWLAGNFFYVSTYMADARPLGLPLVTIGDPGPGLYVEDIHDWHVLLSRFGLLEYDRVLALIPLICGLIAGWGAVVLGAWLCWRMFRSSSQPPVSANNTAN